MCVRKNGNICDWHQAAVIASAVVFLQADLPLFNVWSNVQLVREARPRLSVQIPVAVCDGLWLDLCIFMLELPVLGSFNVCSTM